MWRKSPDLPCRHYVVPFAHNARKAKADRAKTSEVNRIGVTTSPADRGTVRYCGWGGLSAPSVASCRFGGCFRQQELEVRARTRSQALGDKAGPIR